MIKVGTDSPVELEAVDNPTEEKAVSFPLIEKHST